MKRKLKARPAMDYRAGYEKLLSQQQDRAERDEFEALNRRTGERVEALERAYWEQNGKQLQQERRFGAIVKLVITLILSSVFAVCFGVLGFTQAMGAAAAMLCGGAAVLVGAFRTGWLCREIRN